jgi:hypothetical protein
MSDITSTESEEQSSDDENDDRKSSRNSLRRLIDNSMHKNSFEMSGLDYHEAIKITSSWLIELKT